MNRGGGELVASGALTAREDGEGWEGAGGWQEYGWKGKLGKGGGLTWPQTSDVSLIQRHRTDRCYLV